MPESSLNWCKGNVFHSPKTFLSKLRNQFSGRTPSFQVGCQGFESPIPLGILNPFTWPYSEAVITPTCLVGIWDSNSHRVVGDLSPYSRQSNILLDCSVRRSRQIGKVIALSRQNLRVRSPSTLLVLRDIYSHRPSKRTGLAVNQRLLGAVPRLGVASL